MTTATVGRGSRGRSAAGFRIVPAQCLVPGGCSGPIGLTFTVRVDGPEPVELVMFDPDFGRWLADIPFPRQWRHAGLLAMTVLGLDAQLVDYGYRTAGGAVRPDRYGSLLVGRGPGPYRSRVVSGVFDWSDDRRPEVAVDNLNVVRVAFERDCGYRRCGTMLAQWSRLGVNCLSLAPVVDRPEAPISLCAPSRRYADGPRPDLELKELIRQAHRLGIEVVLDVAVHDQDSLVHWVREYHIDGFRFVMPAAPALADNPEMAAVRLIAATPPTESRWIADDDFWARLSKARLPQMSALPPEPRRPVAHVLSEEA